MTGVWLTAINRLRVIHFEPLDAIDTIGLTPRIVPDCKVAFNSQFSNGLEIALGRASQIRLEL